MTPEELDLVGASAARVEEDATRFATVFYDHLFTNWPHTRELFPDDLTQQQAKLADEFVYLAEVASDFGGFVERTRQLGARHRGYGVHVGDYAAVGEALLVALEAVLGDDFNDEVAAAWRKLYRLLAETMIEGASSELFAEH